MKTYVTHLESALDGTHYEADKIQTMHESRPLWVKYNLAQVAENFTKDMLLSREPTMWRYRELLPIGNNPIEVSLGEGMSPLLKCDRLAQDMGLENLWIKDESQLPGGSFKSRGMAMAITMAKHFGIKDVSVPTAGNAGGAAAAYAARAGIGCHIYMPQDTPIVNQYETFHHGAEAVLVDGLINDCGRIIKEQGKDWFDLSTLKEPYRIEGKKTMGLELAEQFNWDLPEVILYPTGGGTGLIGMWKAFAELAEMKWLNEGVTMPKMIVCQSTGCAPIVDAFQKKERFAKPFENAATVASGLRVPVAVGDFMMSDVLTESGGAAVAAEESKLVSQSRRASTLEGISVCPETGACIDVLENLIETGFVLPTDRVVVFNTGAAQKYIEAIQTQLPLHTQ